jgi:hypothetical protein
MIQYHAFLVAQEFVCSYQPPADWSPHPVLWRCHAPYEVLSHTSSVIHHDEGEQIVELS